MSAEDVTSLQRRRIRNKIHKVLNELHELEKMFEEAGEALVGEHIGSVADTFLDSIDSEWVMSPEELEEFTS